MSAKKPLALGMLAVLACLWGAMAARADGDWQFAAGDINRDGDDDLVAIGGGEWYAWMSGPQYVMQGPQDLDLSGGQFVAGDVDGDRQADLGMLSGADWYVWRSGNAYQREGAYPCGVSNGVPYFYDGDNDRRDDPCVVVGYTWHLWASSLNYAKQLPFGFDPGASTGLIPLAWKGPDGDYFGYVRPYAWPDGMLKYRRYPHHPIVGPLRLPYGVPLVGRFDAHDSPDLAVVQTRTNGFWIYTYLSGDNWNVGGPYPLSSARVPGVGGIAWMDTNGCYAAVSVHDIGESTNALVHVNNTRLQFTNRLAFVTAKGYRVDVPLACYYARMPGVKAGDALTLTVYPNNPSYPGLVYQSPPTRLPARAQVLQPANGAKLYAGQPATVSWTAASDRRGCLVSYLGDDLSAAQDDSNAWLIEYVAAPRTSTTVPGSLLVKGEAEFGVAALNGDVQALLASADTNDSFFVTAHYDETRATVETPPPPPSYIARQYEVRQDGLTFKVRETDPQKMALPGRVLIEFRMRKHKISIGFVMTYDMNGQQYFEWSKMRLCKRKGKKYEVVIPVQPYSTLVIGTHDAKLGGITYTPAP